MTKIISKNQIFTIPNLLSFLRILMIPVIVILYCVYDNSLAATGVVILSGLTDIVDGKIARKFNMISDFGKILDPVADKLTQAAIALSLQFNFPHMLWLFILMFVKELIMGVTGALSIKYTGQVYGANWHGKVLTVLLYTMMIIHMVWGDMPMMLSDCLLAVCVVMMVISLFLYVSHNMKLIKEMKEN